MSNMVLGDFSFDIHSLSTPISAGTILLGIKLSTCTFSYKFSFGTWQTVGQFPNCSNTLTLGTAVRNDTNNEKRKYL